MIEQYCFCLIISQCMLLIYVCFCLVQCLSRPAANRYSFKVGQLLVVAGCQARYRCECSSTCLSQFGLLINRCVSDEAQIQRRMYYAFENDRARGSPHPLFNAFEIKAFSLNSCHRMVTLKSCLRVPQSWITHVSSLSPSMFT